MCTSNSTIGGRARGLVCSEETGVQWVGWVGLKGLVGNALPRRTLRLWRCACGAGGAIFALHTGQPGRLGGRLAGSCYASQRASSAAALLQAFREAEFVSKRAREWKMKIRLAEAGE